MNSVICGMHRPYLINMYDDKNDHNVDNNADDVADVAKLLLRMPLKCLRLLPLFYLASTHTQIGH